MDSYVAVIPDEGQEAVIMADLYPSSGLRQGPPPAQFRYCASEPDAQGDGGACDDIAACPHCSVDNMVAFNDVDGDFYNTMCLICERCRRPFWLESIKSDTAEDDGEDGGEDDPIDAADGGTCELLVVESAFRTVGYRTAQDFAYLAWQRSRDLARQEAAHTVGATQPLDLLQLIERTPSCQ